MKHAFFLALLVCSGMSSAKNAITMDEWRGRLGDQLLQYCAAKWYAYQSDADFYYRLFTYSDQLVLHDKEQKISPKIKKAYKESEHCKYKQELVFKRQGSSLYYVNFFHYGFINWNDQEFLAQIKEMVQPKYPVNYVDLPDDRIPVAIHVRRNSNGFDLPILSGNPYVPGVKYVDLHLPLHHPHEQYYVDQLKKVDEILGHQALYVHIFTDDKDPQGITDRLKSAYHPEHIVFGCRTEENSHELNVLDDLFAMSKFKVMIRPLSSFSMMAEMVGDFDLVVSPSGSYWEYRQHEDTSDSVGYWVQVIDEVQMRWPQQDKDKEYHLMWSDHVPDWKVRPDGKVIKKVGNKKVAHKKVMLHGKR